MTTAVSEDLLRELMPQVLGALVRRYGRFDGCEDAVQEAVLAATVQWPAEGVPDNPRGWLVTVAFRRLIDQMRSDHARRERESATAIAEVVPEHVPDTDDTLVLLFLCCHPALTAVSQTALTLRAVGGLTTAEIARAFLVPEATTAARISRAKQRAKAAGGSFGPPEGAEREERLRVVPHVLYLIFNEGCTASSGGEPHRVALAQEAIRRARTVHAQLPEDGEVTGLLALMLLTHARRGARTTAAGDLVPLDEQDRTRWDRALIDEGTELVKAVLAGPALGPCQLQAAIAATHADAATAEETDWPQIHALYLILERIAPNPMVTLNRAVRAHLLEKTGDWAGAHEHYRRAAKATAGIPSNATWSSGRRRRVPAGSGAGPRRRYPRKTTRFDRSPPPARAGQGHGREPAFFRTAARASAMGPARSCSEPCRNRRHGRPWARCTHDEMR
ncbi:RNA polymerase sigma24 factor [Streptomyces fumigatiscleroticus]|nr:RNA polymerase sigma24 factor [Streptomyces fumigatiscleroticus]